MCSRRVGSRWWAVSEFVQGACRHSNRRLASRLRRTLANVEREIAAKAPGGELKRFFRPNDGQDFELKKGDRIVVCTNGLPPGGAERQWVYLAQSLSAIGYNVSFVTFSPLVGVNAHYLPLLKSFRVPLLDASMLSDVDVHRSVPKLRYLKALVAATGTELPADLLRIIAAFSLARPKVVFAQLDDPNLLCGIAGRFCSVPRVIVSFRNYNPTHFDWIYRDWYLACYRLLARSGAIRFTGNSRAANRDYADWIGIARERVHYLPNVVDPASFSMPDDSEIEDLRRGLGIGPDAPVLLGAFRLFPEKDPYTFMDVVRRVQAALPDLKVLVAGFGPMREALEKRVAEYELDESVVFLGSRQDMNKLMRLADVVLLTSIKEGMSNVILEAQLMGTPVVGTAIPGIADVARHDDTGYLRPVKDVEGLAAACIRLLTDKSLATAMGDNGRRHVLENFSNAALESRLREVLYSGM